MLLEVEIVAGENSPLDLHRMFDLISDVREVSRVMAPGPRGDEDVWCEVTGWSDDGPCPARAALSEDSGEGVVLLVYGGGHGIRLRPVGSTGDWDLQDGSQWGEACLMLDSGARAE